MRVYKRLILLIALLFLVAACQGGGSDTSRPHPTPAVAEETQIAAPTVPAPTLTLPPSFRCTPTQDDGVSPTYVPNIPVRNVVGAGHVVTGRILSSVDCQPIPHARLEFWPEIRGQGHPIRQRATFFSDEQGLYRFECDPPKHIHMRISAEGYQTIGVNRYHPEGRTAGTLEIVLSPTLR